MPPPDPLALAMNRPMPLDPNDPTAFMRSIIDAQGRQQIWDTMGGFASGLGFVLHEVDERVFGVAVARGPVGHDFHAVFADECVGVVAEAGVEGVKLAGGRIINAHLEAAGVGFGRSGARRGASGAQAAPCSRCRLRRIQRS